MSDYIWIILLLAPAAFAHGWFVGRHFGVKIGAAGMFDQLYDKGTPVKIPQLVPETKEEIQRFEGALRRKQLSLVLAGKMKAQDATELKALFS